MTKSMTIKQLEEKFPDQVPPINLNFGLGIWYKQIQEKKLNKLTDGDIARLIRQNLYLIYSVEEALNRLEENPTVGELYDGELANSLSQIPKEFWERNEKLHSKAKGIVRAIESGVISLKQEWLFDDDEVCFYKSLEILSENLQ